ncbi:hypothetical protein [Pseudomonas fragi]|uniref:hypothetical protein n=1 Tax=Pseudomonas fragi TaxID=296 RepID=UPI001F262262|nr:hypothetical protein [Pseudomonas fragi]MCF6763811.1 hypothetical protein [Pseudomonas fragi]
MSNYFPIVCEKAGIASLRHAATSGLFERGFTLMMIASITGHKTLAMLKCCTRLSLQDPAEKLGCVLGSR